MSVAGNALAVLIAAEVGARVRALRIERRLTTSCLAARAHTHRPIISRVERGQHLPDWWTLAELARALDMTMRELLCDIDWASIDKAARTTLLQTPSRTDLRAAEGPA